MTRDVFKYFKQVRSLQESTTSERAHELGYEYQSRGVWLDPRTNKKYKAQELSSKRSLRRKYLKENLVRRKNQKHWVNSNKMLLLGNQNHKHNQNLLLSLRYLMV